MAADVEVSAAAGAASSKNCQPNADVESAADAFPVAADTAVVVAWLNSKLVTNQHHAIVQPQ